MTVNFLREYCQASCFTFCSQSEKRVFIPLRCSCLMNCLKSVLYSKAPLMKLSLIFCQGITKLSSFLMTFFLDDLILIRGSFYSALYSSRQCDRLLLFYSLIRSLLFACSSFPLLAYWYVLIKITGFVMKVAPGSTYFCGIQYLLFSSSLQSAFFLIAPTVINPNTPFLLRTYSLITVLPLKKGLFLSSLGSMQFGLLTAPNLSRPRECVSLLMMLIYESCRFLFWLV